jgi:ribonuclease P protein component
VLPREHRLHADRDWDALFQQGFGVSGPVLSFRLCPTPGARRVGFSVGRKIGGAVTRNRLKRRLRSIARAHWAALPEADIAVLARPAAAALDYAGLEAAFRDLAARAARRISASPATSAPEPPR